MTGGVCVRCGARLGPDGACGPCGEGLSFVDRELRRLHLEVAARDRMSGNLVAVPGAGEEPSTVDPEALEGPAFGTAGPRSGTDAPPPATGSAPSPSPRRDVRGEAGAARTGEPAPAQAWGSDAPLRARELDVTTAEGAREALDEVLEHRRRGRGRIIGIAGLPRHGKTKLADRLRERAVERPGVDLTYDKTLRGRVNVYYVPGTHQHHVLIDVAGEDFQLLGDYARDLPALMTEFLWPVLQELDGLLLLQALPIVWSGFNRPGVDRRQDPDPGVREEMRQARDAMVDAHRTLLKYAVVARGLRRLGRRGRRLGLRRDRAPSRTQVDEAYRQAPRLPYPVLVAFSKADLYAPGDLRRGLFSPSPPGVDGPPPPLHPLRTDPLALAQAHFSDLFAFLQSRVRHFKFDFLQALEDPTERPDPQEARVQNAPIESLVGAESALAFLTGHPWRFPGISTRTALRLDRWLRRERWSGGAIRALGGAPPEGGP